MKIFRIRQYILILLTGLFLTQIVKCEDSLSIRSKGNFGLSVGIGSIKAMYLEGKYYYSNSNTIGLSIGTIPFIEISGEKITSFSFEFDHLLRPDRKGSLTLGVIFSIATLKTTSHEYIETAYMLTPNIGADFISSSNFNISSHFGPIFGFSDKKSSKILFGFDINLGLTF